MDLSSAPWRKSSHSVNQTSCVEVAPVRVPDAHWRTSTHSANQTACVEVAPLRAATGVRDSKNPTDGTLLLPRPTWQHFVTAIRTGALTGED